MLPSKISSRMVKVTLRQSTSRSTTPSWPTARSRRWKSSCLPSTRRGSSPSLLMISERSSQLLSLMIYSWWSEQRISSGEDWFFILIRCYCCSGIIKLSILRMKFWWSSPSSAPPPWKRRSVEGWSTRSPSPLSGWPRPSRPCHLSPSSTMAAPARRRRLSVFTSRLFCFRISQMIRWFDLSFSWKYTTICISELYGGVQLLVPPFPSSGWRFCEKVLARQGNP